MDFTDLSGIYFILTSSVARIKNCRFLRSSKYLGNQGVLFCRFVMLSLSEIPSDFLESTDIPYRFRGLLILTDTIFNGTESSASVTFSADKAEFSNVTLTDGATASVAVAKVDNSSFSFGSLQGSNITMTDCILDGTCTHFLPPFSLGEVPYHFSAILVDTLSISDTKITGTFNSEPLIVAEHLKIQQSTISKTISSGGMQM